MSRVLYLDCVAGVAGDMLLGALLDAGADPQRVRAGLAGLGIEGLELRTEPVTRHAISATHATIHAAPVIGVPTSTGYGAALSGVTALLAMLVSCAAGVAVVNIDDGFGAGTIAARIARSAGGA